MDNIHNDYKKYLKYKKKYLELKELVGSGRKKDKKTMKDAVRGAVMRAMVPDAPQFKEEPYLNKTSTAAPSDASAAATKKIIFCEVAVIMKLRGSKPVLFYIGENESGKSIEGESSRIINIDERSSFIQCETRSSIYRIPKKKLHDGTTLIKEFLKEKK